MVRDIMGLMEILSFYMHLLLHIEQRLNVIFTQ